MHSCFVVTLKILNTDNENLLVDKISHLIRDLCIVHYPKPYLYVRINNKF